MVDVNIGDKVAFIFPSSLLSVEQNIFVADVISFGSGSGLLNLDVRTPSGSFRCNDIPRNELQNTPKTWHKLVKVDNPDAIEKRLCLFYPAAGTTVGTVMGMTLTSAGTVSHPAIDNANLLNSIRRTRWTSATTANAVGGIFSAQDLVWRGNSDGLGGFVFKIRFAQNTNINGGRAFIGLSTSATSVVAGEPSAANNSFGVGYDSTDPSNGNWQLIKRGLVSGKTPIIGMPRNIVIVYDLIIRCEPNSNIISVIIRSVNTGRIIMSERHIANIPLAGIFLRIHAALGAAATTQATQLDISHIYLETDN